MSRARLAIVLILSLASAGCSATSSAPRAIEAQPRLESLPAGAVSFDLYRPAGSGRAPLVVVAHGWTRSKANMRGWGQRLAEAGFVVLVPTLPTLADHPRNGQAIAQLIAHAQADAEIAPLINPRRVGVMGFSAGGLAAFLAAAQSDAVDIWIGLDPVDRQGLAVTAARNVRFRTMALLAEPSGCNKNSNWKKVVYPDRARALTLVVADAVHTDCENPTDILLAATCGPADARRRETFMEYATAALRAELLADRGSERFLANFNTDTRVRVVEQPPTGATARLSPPASP